MSKPGGEHDFDPLTRDWLFIKPSPDPELVKAVAQQEAGLPPEETKAGRILRIVAAEFGLTVALLRGPRRERALPPARFAAVALLLEFCPEMSLTQLARIMHRDHTTIIHARRRAAELLHQDRHSLSWRRRYHTARARFLGER
jgi:chromosomal replication initiation ATPase DnaA